MSAPQFSRSVRGMISSAVPAALYDSEMIGSCEGGGGGGGEVAEVRRRRWRRWRRWRWRWHRQPVTWTFDPSISAWASVISDAPPPGTRRGSW